MFVKISDGQISKYPYSILDLRRDNPSTSFPKAISNDVLAIYGVFPVSVSAAPTFDALVETLVLQDAPVETAGQWSISYDVEQKPEAMASANVRNERSRLLSKTDWMALSDNTMTTEWASYRQALRDITSQSGFPYSVEWPAAPGE
jgi:hypothetical protein